MDIKRKWNFLYPENLKKYKNLSTISGLLTDDIVDELLPAIDTLSIYLNMELLSDSILDELAKMWNVEFYNSLLPKSEKINLIKNSYYFHSQKGTTGVLQDALKIIYSNIDLKEWYEYGGLPFYFKIVSDKIFSIEEIDKINEFIKIYKNTRSTLEGIESKTYYPGQILLGSGTGVLSRINVYNENNFNLALGTYLTSRLKVSQYQGGA